MKTRTPESSRLFVCVSCIQQVFICRRCDRGNIYCGKECASKARTHRHREANKRYGQSSKGRFTSAARSRRYRQNQSAKKIVTDQGSTPKGADAPLRSNPEAAPERGESGETRIIRSFPEILCTGCRQPLGSWARTGYLRSEPNLRIVQGHSRRDHRKRPRRNH